MHNPAGVPGPPSSLGLRRTDTEPPASPVSVMLSATQGSMLVWLGVGTPSELRWLTEDEDMLRGRGKI